MYNKLVGRNRSLQMRVTGQIHFSWAGDVRPLFALYQSTDFDYRCMPGDPSFATTYANASQGMCKGPSDDWASFAARYVTGSRDAVCSQTKPVSCTSSPDPLQDPYTHALGKKMKHVYEAEGYLPTYTHAKHISHLRAMWYSRQIRKHDTGTLSRICRLMSQLLQLPYVSVKIMAPQSESLEEELSPYQVMSEWTHASEDGIQPDETGLCQSVWSHALYLPLNQVLVVPDAPEDWRFSHHISRHKLRFLACTPIFDTHNEALGVCCMGDIKPRHGRDLDDAARSILDMKQMIINEIDLAVNRAQVLRRDELKGCTESLLRTFRMESVAGPHANTELEGRDQVYHLAANALQSSMHVSDVIILDLSNFVMIQKTFQKDGENQKVVHLHTLDPNKSQSRIAPLSILGSSESQVHVPAREAALDMNDVHAIQDFLMLTESDDENRFRLHVPPVIRRLLPSQAADVFAVPVWGAKHQPSLLVCAYCLPNCYSLMIDQMQHTALQHIRAIGLMMLDVVDKETVLIADRAKSTFISNMSHELRTPLHGILASADILSESGLNELQGFYLETIKSCGHGLLELVNHVLDYTKLSGGASGTQRRLRNVNMSDFDLCRLVQEVCDSHALGHQVTPLHNNQIGSMYDPQGPAEERAQGWSDVEFVVNIEKRLRGWYVHSDCGGLRRVLMNLVGNALKFTTKGFVEVSLSGTEIDHDTLQIFLRVRDSGCGISRQFLDQHLFRPFSQENPLGSGTGLGLSIVHDIMDSLDGGTVNVHSTQGIGTDIVTSCHVRKLPASSDVAYIPQLDVHQTCTAHLFGFSTDRDSGRILQETLAHYLSTWWGFLVCVHREDEDASSLAASMAQRNVVLLNNRSALVHRLMRQKNLPPLILLTDLYSKQLFADAFEEYRQGGGHIYLLQKPTGPARMEDVLRACLEQAQNQPTGSISLTRLKLSELPKVSPAIPEINTNHGNVLASPDRNELERSLKEVATYASPSSPTVKMVPDSNFSFRVLFADDNPINCQMLAAYLRKLHLPYVEARDGCEAVAAFASKPHGYFHLVLMDFSMPNIDGLQACMIIRHIERQRNMEAEAQHRCHAYMLSGASMEEILRQGTNAGADGYLVKPLSFKAFVALIEKLDE